MILGGGIGGRRNRGNGRAGGMFSPVQVFRQMVILSSIGDMQHASHVKNRGV
jgi:hypothetical protein